MPELDDETRAQAARILGMKPSEIVAVAGVPYGDGDDTGAVVETHDGVRTLIAPDRTLSTWDGPMPGDTDDVEAGDDDPVDDGDPDDETDGGASGDPEAVPDGTVDEVLAWVGEDRERATRALQSEQGRGKPRASLTAQLEKLAGLA